MKQEIGDTIFFKGEKTTIHAYDNGYYVCMTADGKVVWLPIDNDNKSIRSFTTGATRDTDEGKYDYEGFLSPLVIEAYAAYMNKHRVQADGSLRDSDNWQKGFGDNHLDVCMKSGYRHFMDWWKEHRGLDSRDGIDEAICGLLFNVMAYYKKVLDNRIEGKEK